MARNDETEMRGDETGGGGVADAIRRGLWARQGREG